MHKTLRAVAIGAALVVSAAGVARGDAPADTTRSDDAPALPVFEGETLVVTPTRVPQRAFDSASPAEAFGLAAIRRVAAGSVTDVFRNMPGVDVSGVGANQARPTVRGQRGQRILLLENGLRLDNPRRERNFGELLALVDVDHVERVEIVRGASSVLYGSDAIGGVINLITPRSVPSPRGGRVGYRYAGSGDHHRGHGTLWGERGAWSGWIRASARRIEDYTAPSGTFGNITLNDETTVRDTGGEDLSVSGTVSFKPSRAWRLSAGYQTYRADTTGFGFVDPEAYGEEGLIRIRYPELTFDKYTLEMERTALPYSWLREVGVQAYAQRNQRELLFELKQSIGPGAELAIDESGQTDLLSTGVRVEAKGRPDPRVQIVYGLDFVRDDSENEEISETLITGFGQPMLTVNDSTAVPNANQTNLGFFAQSTVDLSSRASVVVGGRWQRVESETEVTPRNAFDPVSRTEQTVVGSLNARYELTSDVALVGTAGRAFRSPNIIERYFDGTVAEAGGYQRANPDLDAETSLNFDLGVRFRDVERGLRADVFVFRNTVFDGIRIAPTGGMVDGQPEFRNENVDELRFLGVEMSAEARIVNGVTVSGNYTHLDSEDVNEPSNPIGESFSDKFVGGVAYDDPRGRFTLGYEVRVQGETNTLDLGLNPLGDTIPSLDVHTVRAGVNVGTIRGVQPRLTVVVANVTDELFAEVGNASFFRPSPGRHVILRWDVGF